MDYEIYRNDKGHKLIVEYHHGKYLAPDGSIEDITKMVFIYQSADNKTFTAWATTEALGTVTLDGYKCRQGFQPCLT